MIHNDELEGRKQDCIRTINLKRDCASKGHDHVVLSQTICSFKLLEMISEIQNFRKKFGNYEGLEE